ncbi:UDP-glycosyltransferase 92A1-like [Oryza brachyantha]|uniref:UDP-glycosyltransferase 92A1-like n=1 Tax=Oryza brachyantha TaxID=4533 RepID=UPI001ADBA68B|nr:UDP-glycosyltransferase 92A1-like [Oryza brachyantha]
MADADQLRRGGARAHVVLFPFMAQGHVAPFRCLAALVRRSRPDARLTVVATPGVAEAFRAHLAADGVGAAAAAAVHALPFCPAEHGLPADAETSASIGFQQIITLFLASESLRPAFRRFVDGLRAANPGDDVHVMADMFLGWAVDVARDAGASSSVVLTCGGYGSALYFSLWDSVPLPATTSPDDDFPLPRFPGVRVQRSQLTDHLAAADGKDAWSGFIQRQIAAFYRADALLVNTAENLEPKGLRMLRQWLNVPTYPVGPLLRAAAPSPEGKKTTSPILAWLDKQPPASVLYISFGSQYTITAPQMMALACGLEQSGHRFVWVIRPPAGHDVNGEFSPEWLPEKFKERAEAEGRGLVARCWAPQVEILAHAATGAFLTHCGWNSVQEALGHGVPLLGWPLSAEQFYNAKVLAEEDEETGAVCVEVARGTGAAVDAAKVAAAVEAVLGETAQSAAMRRRAAEMKVSIVAARDGGDASSETVMRRFLDAVAPPRVAQFAGAPSASACFREVAPGTASRRVVNSGHFTQ